jgi:hypothetical protein
VAEFSGGAARVGWHEGGGLIGGACTLVRGREREGAADGRRESKRKAYSREYAKGVRGPMRGMTAYK